jgi:hypothetical protein
MANVNGGGVQPLVSEAVDRPDPPELHIQPDFFFFSAFENILSHSASAVLLLLIFLYHWVNLLTDLFLDCYFVTMGPSVKRRKVSKTEEVNFDPEARQEWLTGFRKRKQERIKHGQAAAEKRYKEERRHDRARVSSASCRILCPRVKMPSQD